MIVYGTALAAWWLVFIGFTVGAIVLCGFIFEYYRGEHAHCSSPAASIFGEPVRDVRWTGSSDLGSSSFLGGTSHAHSRVRSTGSS